MLRELWKIVLPEFSGMDEEYSNFVHRVKIPSVLIRGYRIDYHVLPMEARSLF